MGARDRILGRRSKTPFVGFATSSNTQSQTRFRTQKSLAKISRTRASSLELTKGFKPEGKKQPQHTRLGGTTTTAPVVWLSMIGGPPTRQAKGQVEGQVEGRAGGQAEGEAEAGRDAASDPGSRQEASRRHPGGIQEAARRQPGGSQEAARRQPGGGGEATRRQPGGSLGADSRAAGRVVNRPAAIIGRPACFIQFNCHQSRASWRLVLPYFGIASGTW